MSSIQGYRVARLWTVRLLSLLLLVVTACEDSSETPDAHIDPLLKGRPASQSSLQQGLDFLNTLDESNSREAQRRIQQQLQDWLSQQKADPQWSPDSMRTQLPSPFDQMSDPAQLAKLSIDVFDVIVLREALWLRDIAQTKLSQGRLDPYLQDLVAKSAAAGSGDLQNDLTSAARLFDWTVLNLQLDADFDAESESRFQSNLVLQSWECLLMGRGTLEEKSRIFSQLARQLRLPVVMLAIERPGEAPLPWLPALLTHDQLYLFDMRLGTPLVDPATQQLLTWNALRANPDILSTLQRESGEPYPVQPSDLSQLVVWVDATPSDLSQRMQLLERALLGDNKMALTANPTALAEQLKKIEGVTRVGLWPLPYLSFAQRSSLDPNSPTVAELSMEHSLFERQPFLRMARVQHFRGQYESTESQRGARPLYLLSRIPEEEIAKILDVPLAVPSGTTLSAEDQENHRLRQEYAHSLARRSKQNASYWLGLIALDQGEYAVAYDFFEKRLLQMEPDSIWAPGAYYALGRTLEAWGRTDSNTERLQEALQAYRAAPESIYAAARNWRAAQLDKQLHPAASPDASESSTSESSAPEQPESGPSETSSDDTSASEENPGAETSEEDGPAESTDAAANSEASPPGATDEAP